MFTMFQALALGASASTIKTPDPTLMNTAAVLPKEAESTPPAVRTMREATPVAVPESPSLILVGLGLVASARYLRRRRVS